MENLATLFYTTQSERIQLNINNVQYQIIGVSDDYADLLKTLVDNKDDYTQLFINEIPYKANQPLIQQLRQQFEILDLANLTTDDIIMFKDTYKNQQFVNALNHEVKKIIKQGKPKSVQINQIITLCLYVNTYLTGNLTRIIYYGNLTKLETYFLNIASQLNVDILYFNTTKQPEDLDLPVVNYKLHQEVPLNYWLDKGQVQQKVTITKLVELQSTQQLAEQTGLYQPWQLQSQPRYVKPLSVSVYDMYNLWQEDNYMRPNFTNDVHCPTIQYVIEGVNANYATFVNQFSETHLTKLYIANAYHSHLVKKTMAREEKLKLNTLFNRLGDIDFEKVTQYEHYPYSKYDDLEEKRFIEVINNYLKDKSKQEKIDTLSEYFNLDPDIFRYLSQYDVTRKVPKLIIFLENEETIHELDKKWLVIISQLGFDLLVFSPAGCADLTAFKILRLDELKFDQHYPQKKVRLLSWLRFTNL